MSHWFAEQAEITQSSLRFKFTLKVFPSKSNMATGARRPGSKRCIASLPRFTILWRMQQTVRFISTGFMAAALITFASSVSARGGDATAFSLIKEGNRYVGEQAKDRVVQIRSEKSVGSTTPNIWYVVFYDPTASLKAVEVKFGAGQMLSVKRPMRLLEPVTGGDLPLDRNKLKIDSPEAIQVALKQPMLEHLKITATRLTLDRVGEGVLGQAGPGQGVWKVRLWASKLRDPARDADIGEVWVSALDGQVVKNDLRINRVD